MLTERSSSQLSTKVKMIQLMSVEVKIILVRIKLGICDKQSPRKTEIEQVGYENVDASVHFEHMSCFLFCVF